MEEQQGYDLDAHDVRPMSQTGVEMTLLDPAGKATGVKLVVRGTDSAEYQDTLKAHVKRAVDRAPRKPTDEEKEAEFWELNATLLAGWSGLFSGGKEFAYSPANAARLIREHPYIFEQVLRFSRERANFLRGPARA